MNPFLPESSRLFDVVHLVVREGLSSVFDAQVLTPVSRHASNVKARVVVCEPIGSFIRAAGRGRRYERRVRARALGVDVSTIPSAPARMRWAWHDRHLMKHWLRRRYRSDDQFVLHARGSAAAALALEMRQRFSNARVIFDCRGCETAEYLDSLHSTHRLPSRRLLDEIQARERHSATQADAVICVSNALASHLSKQYGIPQNAITVTPCCVDSTAFERAAHARTEVRRELGVSDRFVVAYSGALQWYQCPAESLEIFCAIKAIRPNAHLLVLTQSAEHMRRLCASAGMADDDCTILPLSPGSVPRYLAAADVGLLLRHQALVNQVASPVKFGEYLASGIPVILSDGIGDYSDLARAQDVGLVLPATSNSAWTPASADLVAAFLNQYTSVDWRRRCQRIARLHLDWRVHVPRIAAVYEDLLKTPFERSVA